MSPVSAAIAAAIAPTARAISMTTGQGIRPGRLRTMKNLLRESGTGHIGGASLTRGPPIRSLGALRVGSDGDPTVSRRPGRYRLPHTVTTLTVSQGPRIVGREGREGRRR